MKVLKRKIQRSNKILLFIYTMQIVFLLVSSFIFCVNILKLNGIENILRYILIIILVFICIYFIIRNIKLIFRRKNIRFIFNTVISILISIILIILSNLITTIYGALSNIVEDDTYTYTSKLISLNNISDSEYVGIISDKDNIEGYKLGLELIEKYNIKEEIKYYDDYKSLIDDLYNGVLKYIIVPSNYIDLFYEDYETIEEDTKVIKEYSKEVKLSSKKDVSLDKPFTVLVLGVDTESKDGVKQNSSFNGDTLMLISFNPKTLNATVFSIPRDLYVPISCNNNKLNKINSAAAGGTNCVINTIKNLTNLDIDYVAKINFRGVVDLVDAIGGVDVFVQQEFCEQDSHRNFDDMICVKEGMQHLDGEEALAFARHRHSYLTGDLMRIQNQQILVDSVIKKSLELSSVNDLKKVINAISNNISINMDINELLSSYNILKNMVINTVSGKDLLVLNKTYLEVYDLPIYLDNGRYISALGYYENSLNDIVKHMEINLDIRDKELIKTFNYDSNVLYEKYIPGKGIR